MPEEVFDLARAQRGVDGDEDRADLRERELQDDPLGHVGGPHRDAVAAIDAGADQPPRDQARFALEVAKGPAQVGLRNRRGLRDRAAMRPAASAAGRR